jgi:hypothetical protein
MNGGYASWKEDQRPCRDPGRAYRGDEGCGRCGDVPTVDGGRTAVTLTMGSWRADCVRSKVCDCDGQDFESLRWVRLVRRKFQRWPTRLVYQPAARLQLTVRVVCRSCEPAKSWCRNDAQICPRSASGGNIPRASCYIIHLSPLPTKAVHGEAEERAWWPQSGSRSACPPYCCLYPGFTSATRSTNLSISGSFREVRRDGLRYGCLGH